MGCAKRIPQQLIGYLTPAAIPHNARRTKPKPKYPTSPTVKNAAAYLLTFAFKKNICNNDAKIYLWLQIWTKILKALNHLTGYEAIGVIGI